MVSIDPIGPVSCVKVAGYFSDLLVLKSDYYLGNDGQPRTSPGWWGGKLARSLGLDGEITTDQFVRALDGRHPDTGERLRRWQKNRKAGWDVTVSPPKCVSVAWAVGDWEERAVIEGRHADAVKGMVAYAEEHLRLARYGTNGKTWERASEVLCAVFDHHTARQTAEQIKRWTPPDMHVHSHVVFLGQRRHDGKTGAVHERDLYRFREELEAVYYNQLATGLAEDGYVIERGVGKGGRDFAIKGIPVELCQRFSSRSEEIGTSLEKEAAAFHEKYGRDPDVVERRRLALRCRQAKGHAYGNPTTWWRAIAKRYGVTPESVKALRSGGDTRPSPALGRGQVAIDLLSEDGLTREEATVTSRAVRSGAFRRAAGRVMPSDALHVLGDLAAKKELVPREKGRWTTRTTLEREKAVFAWRNAMEAAPPPPKPQKRLVWRALKDARKESGIRLTGEQLDAFRHIVSHWFTALTGEAGVGKGVVLGAAARVWREQHRRVFAVAVAGATAQRFAATLGEGSAAMTLDGLITRLEHGRIDLRNGDVIAIDEAGMIDTRRWARLVSVVKDRPGVTVVAVGDEAQLSPLSAGGLWPLLAKDGPRLSEVHRAQSAWEREAWGHLRRGEMAGVEAYAAHGRMVVSETRSESLATAVAAWDGDGRTGRITTDASNEERDAANRAAQERKLAAGELGRDSVVFAPTACLHTGDSVIFRRQWRIGGGVRRVENGTTGTVVAVDTGKNMVTVRTDEPQSRDLEAGHDPSSPLLALNYAAHVYKAQGETVGRCYAVVGGWQTNRENLYVTCSRAREGTRLFVDTETLGAVMGEDAVKALAGRAERSRAKRAAMTSSEIEEQAPRRRTRRTLTSDEPLMAAWNRRCWRRERARGRADAAYGAECAARQRRQHAPSVRALAVANQVPEWVVEATKFVTGRRFGGA
ncbi:MAG: MobF family relaxase [Frankiaceae bacterium]